MDFSGAFSPDHLKFLWDGLEVTLEVAVASVFFSFLLGTVIAIIQYARIPILSHFLRLWVGIVGNLPLLFIIFATYYVIPPCLHLHISSKLAVTVALVVFESAIFSDLSRKVLCSIHKGQIEAALATGLGHPQTLRYIIFPQFVRQMAPHLVSQSINTIKESSLGFIIPLEELMYHAQIIYNQKISYVFPILLFVAIVYFVINYSLSILSRKLELRFQS